MRTVLLTLAVFFCCGSNVPAAEPTAKLVSVKKIWDQAPHNAFTDLIRFQDRWLCTFREGTGHASGAGGLRVLASSDGEKWESLALVEQQDVDLRDPKLSLLPDGRLLLVGAAAVPATRNPLKDHYSIVSFSKDGKEWTPPAKVLDSWQWLWRVTWHKGVAYGVAYLGNPKDDGSKERLGAFLAKSTDGTKFEKVIDLKQVNATEATLAFDGDAMLCLQRRDNKPNSALLGTSQPPYTDWTWKDLGIYYGGPNFIRLKDGWWACGRIVEGGKPQTVLCRLDVAAGKLTPALTLPSGGDTSYPGLVWHQDQLWISYYSSHEGKSSIYLARVEVK